MDARDFGKDARGLLRHFNLPDIMPRQGLAGEPIVHDVGVCLFGRTAILSQLIKDCPSVAVEGERLLLASDTPETLIRIREQVEALEVAAAEGQSLVDRFDKALTDYRDPEGFPFGGLIHAYALLGAVYYARRAVEAGKAALAGRLIPVPLEWNRDLLSKAVVAVRQEAVQLGQESRQAAHDRSTLGVDLRTVRVEPPVPREPGLALPARETQIPAIHLLKPTGHVYCVKLFVNGCWTDPKEIGHRQYHMLDELIKAPGGTLSNNALNARCKRGKSNPDARATLKPLLHDADFREVLFYEADPDSAHKGKLWRAAFVNACSPRTPGTPRSPSETSELHTS